MLHVAVAVIRDAEGRVLLSRRREGTHLAGLWEFPGGKLETGESIGAALRREILEETGITVTAHRPLIGIRHHYQEKSVFLDTHLVTAWSGDAHGREGQEVAWCDLSALDAYPLPAADKPILAALRLPSFYAITPPLADEAQLLRELQATLEAGIRLVQLRLPGREDLAALSARAQALCGQHGATLMVKEVELARRLGCGLHLRSADLMKLSHSPVGDDQLLAASCHTLEEALHAEKIGADFITFSPVQKTASHPDAAPLGWEAFSRLVEEINLPVYALGGLGKKDLEAAWASGGQGVAGIRGVWSLT